MSASSLVLHPVDPWSAAEDMTAFRARLTTIGLIGAPRVRPVDARVRAVYTPARPMRSAICLLLLACALAACADPPTRDAAADAPALDAARDTTDHDTLADNTAPDVPALPDATPDVPVAADATPLDAPPPDAPADTSARPDASDAAAAPDAARDVATADAPADVPTGPTHVHIDIDNFCHVAVTPMSATVPVMSRAMFAFHNHSRDYHADVWMSYGGGFLDLGLGATWNDPIGHCNTPTVHDEYADINIAGGPTSACPGVRFLIHCR